jgi:hypothetical protein
VSRFSTESRKLVIVSELEQLYVLEFPTLALSCVHELPYHFSLFTGIRALSDIRILRDPETYLKHLLLAYLSYHFWAVSRRDPFGFDFCMCLPVLSIIAGLVTPRFY